VPPQPWRWVRSAGWLVEWPHQGHWCYPQRYPSFDAVGNKCTKSLILLVSRLGLEPRTP
jgi:hypothetical protein